MNRSAYLTTGVAIRAIEYFANADIGVHGKDNIPADPTIFVVNHFTRFETFVLPYYIYNLTGTPVWSLGHANLFKGGFAKSFFNMVGVISTKDPKRDNLILKALLTGEANWIIFPEGSMVKTKKIISDGNFMVSTVKGMRKPHTGAASLAIKAEMLRNYFYANNSNEKIVEALLHSFDLDSLDQVSRASTNIVPVNITYYPIRAVENFMVNVAQTLVKDIPEKVIEELMLEGSMLINGVDLDIRFGEPIVLNEQSYSDSIVKPIIDNHHKGAVVNKNVKKQIYGDAMELMQNYMGDIYSMTTINHEHIFATFLRLYPYKKIRRQDFCRRVFLAVSNMLKERDNTFYFHKSFNSSQLHLISDDRYGKFTNFIDLALEKGVLEKDGEHLVKDRKKISGVLSLLRGRIENPIEVMANEVEPLTKLYSLLKSWAWQPDFLVKLLFIRHVLSLEKEQYQKIYNIYQDELLFGKEARARLYPSWKFDQAVLLVHSYLASPAEMEGLAKYLVKKGVWVYTVRLAGHGTVESDLAAQSVERFRQSMDIGYGLLSAICKNVVAGGVSFGGAMALDLASRVKGVAGVFSIGAPYDVKDYNAEFMITSDVWEGLLNRISGKGKAEKYLQVQSDSPFIKYAKNPVSAVEQVAKLLKELQKNIGKISQPSLFIHSDEDELVNKKGSKKYYKHSVAVNKKRVVIHSKDNTLVNSSQRKQLFRLVDEFLQELTGNETF